MLRTRILHVLLAALIFVPLFSRASVTVVVNGSNHTIPQTNEKGWGTNVTAWIQAISSYTLQPSGGTFTLTAETDFGATYGLKVPYIKTATATPSTVGVLRLANTDSMGWRNAGNSANLLLTVDSSNNLLFNGAPMLTNQSASIADNIFRVVDDGDSTKKIAWEASGITTGTTRTITVPDYNVNLGGLTNQNIAAAAGISYSKLALTNSVVNADIGSSAAIAYSKLALSNSVVNADVNSSAAIAYSKLNLSASILNADINSSAAIAYAKLNLASSIVNTDLSGTASISRAKIAPGTADHVLINDSTGSMSSAARLTSSQIPTTVVFTDAINTLTNQNVNSFTGLASRPAMKYTGTPFTGGSSTTTMALLDIEDAGTTNAWSTSGTYLGINGKTAFTGNLIDAQQDAVARFTISAGGKMFLNDTAGTSAANFKAPSIAVPTVNIKAITSQTSDLLQVMDSSGTPKFIFDVNGNSKWNHNVATSEANFDVRTAVVQATASTGNPARYNMFVGDAAAVAAGRGAGIALGGPSTGSTALSEYGYWWATKNNASSGDLDTSMWFATRRNSDSKAALVMKMDEASQTILFGNMVMNGTTSGTFTQNVPATVTSYRVTWPSAQGGASTLLQNDGTGVLSWSAAGAASGLVLLSTQTASTSASIEFTSGIDSTYEAYMFVIENYVPATNATTLNVTFSTNAGSSYLSASYHHSRLTESEGSAVSVGGSASDSKITIGTVNNASGESANWTCMLSNPSQANYYKDISCSGGGYNGAVHYVIHVGGAYVGATTAINAIKFAPSSGNITTGIFKLYGLRKTP